MSSRTITRMFRLECENEQLVVNLQRQTELSEANRATAESAIHEKNRFLAAASHDLRQPLHASGLLLEVLQQHIHSGEGRKILQGITDALNGLNLSFKGMLDISQLDAGVVEQKKRHVALQQILQSLTIEFEVQSQNAQLNYSAVCANEVIKVDPTLFERVLRNLVSNAINYTVRGGVTIQCSQQSPGLVQILIKDTGIGIASTEIDNVFSEFYQVRNPERDRSKGLGLGLAIAKRLCDIMDISISLTSAVDAGTTFTLLVPSGNAANVAAVSTARPLTDLTSVNALVIDDDEHILEGMQQLLTSWGCRVVTADSADTAITALMALQEDPNVIIADYRLGNDSTGVEAIHRVYDELNQIIPAFIITGDTSPDRLTEVQESGFDIIHKPVLPSDLREHLQLTLGTLG